MRKTPICMNIENWDIDVVECINSDMKLKSPLHSNDQSLNMDSVIEIK